MARGLPLQGAYNLRFDTGTNRWKETRWKQWWKVAGMGVDGGWNAIKTFRVLLKLVPNCQKLVVKGVS